MERVKSAEQFVDEPATDKKGARKLSSPKRPKRPNPTRPIPVPILSGALTVC